MKTILIIHRKEMPKYYSLPNFLMEITKVKVYEAMGTEWLKSAAKILNESSEKCKIVFNNLSYSKIVPDEPYLILPNVQVIHLL